MHLQHLPHFTVIPVTFDAVYVIKGLQFRPCKCLQPEEPPVTCHSFSCLLIESCILDLYFVFPYVFFLFKMSSPFLTLSGWMSWLSVG